MKITWRKVPVPPVAAGIMYALDLDGDPTGLVLSNVAFDTHQNHKWKIVKTRPWEIQEVPDHLQGASIELIKEYAIAIWRLEQ